MLCLPAATDGLMLMGESDNCPTINHCHGYRQDSFWVSTSMHQACIKF